MDCGQHYADGEVALRQEAAVVAPLWGFRLQVPARRPAPPAPHLAVHTTVQGHASHEQTPAGCAF